MTDARHIPQVLLQQIYHDHLADDLTITPIVARTYASLCLSRTLPGVDPWVRAAEELRLPGELGVAVASRCSARLTVDNSVFVEHLLDVQAALPVDIDYRSIEDHIYRLAQEPSWLHEWLGIGRGDIESERRNVLTWMWLHLAHAHPDTAPLTGHGVRGPAARRAYELFEKSFSTEDQKALTHAFDERALP